MLSCQSTVVPKLPRWVWGEAAAEIEFRAFCTKRKKIRKENTRKYIPGKYHVGYILTGFYVFPIGGGIF